MTRWGCGLSIPPRDRTFLSFIVKRGFLGNADPRFRQNLPHRNAGNPCNRVVGNQPVFDSDRAKRAFYPSHYSRAIWTRSRAFPLLVDVTNCYREETLPICVGGERHAEDGYCENKPNSGNRIIGPAFMPAWSHCKRFADVDSWSRETRNATVTWLVPSYSGLHRESKIVVRPWPQLSVKAAKGPHGWRGREGVTEVGTCRPQSKNRSGKNFSWFVVGRASCGVKSVRESKLQFHARALRASMFFFLSLEFKISLFA